MELSNQKQEALLELMASSGYDIVQENGQRKYGPPPGWGGRKPPGKGSEIFIGKIPRDCYEDELVPVFARIGPIYDLRLMMDFSGSNRGYAFLSYCEAEHARIAVQELDNYQIRPGKHIGVVKSKDNCRLFVGRIPREKSREEIIAAMSEITDDVVDAIVHPLYKDKSKNRGYAFVEYANHRAAAMARRKLLPGKYPIFECEIQVDWADPEIEVDEQVMQNVTVLYVRNLIQPVSEFELMNTFEFGNRGTVTKVKQIKDFAFIHYVSRNWAEQALEQAQNDTGFGQSLAATPEGLSVTWAKPPNKDRPRRNKFYNQRENDHQSFMSPTPHPNLAYGHQNYRPPYQQMRMPQAGDPYKAYSPRYDRPSNQEQYQVYSPYAYQAHQAQQSPRKPSGGDIYNPYCGQNFTPLQNQLDYMFTTPPPRMPVSMGNRTNFYGQQQYWQGAL
ncbi:APOBEC1 complementation factor [Halotydeus destructor]|nr:APOBEC1 complementation factor [Halotydeus destructor]